jgi:flavin-dependent dehydrogenase
MAIQSAICDRGREVIIVGAGPAGASLAIRMAAAGHAVTLVEKERFPREKLCGEFISPECFRHFAELGVLEEMLSLGGARLTETRFFDPAGTSVTVPTRWFGYGDFALSLSRARMDATLMDRAKAVGVTVLEGSRVMAANVEDARVGSVTVRSDVAKKVELVADLFIDATGRAGALTRLAETAAQSPPKRPRLVAFKGHLREVNIGPNACEIYVFPGGYGGLSPIEDGRANLCFIVRAEVAKMFIGKTNKHLELIASRNRRAAKTLSGAIGPSEWLAVPIGEFGRKTRRGPSNLIAIGDAAAFIDPFTGSGMLMAMETAELFSKCVREAGPDPAHLNERYAREHWVKFRNRLAASAVLRRAAFMPRLATAAILAAGLSDGLRERLARATRSGSRPARKEG